MKAVVYCGSMGDWPLLTDEERQKGVEALVEAGFLRRRHRRSNPKTAAAHAAHARKPERGLMLIPRAFTRHIPSRPESSFCGPLEAADGLPSIIYNSPYYGFETKADLSSIFTGNFLTWLVSRNSRR